MRNSFHVLIATMADFFSLFLGTVLICDIFACVGGFPTDREKIYNFFISRPDLETPIEIAKAEHRELAYKQMKALVLEAGINPMKFLMEDPARYFVVTEAVGYIDVSLGIKVGVQFR